MRKAVLAVALAAALSTSAPALAADPDRDDGDHRSLKVTGLTVDQRLVKFRTSDHGLCPPSPAIKVVHGEGIDEMVVAFAPSPTRPCRSLDTR
ncbi:hypothetical protein ACFWR9_00910 [Streptomyces sp. NPDC058534]|uniref:hypothetical protein n=1 Tax=Streptomyces sp. NPDC058534 TaxID=3346541 RepID=UPI00365CD6E4